MLGRPSKRASVVNRAAGAVRWATPRRGRRPWRGRRLRRAPRRRVSPGRPVRVDRVTFALTRNNFWGSLHRRGGRLVRSWSAGQMPGAAGSKRGRPTAAVDLAVRMGRHLADRRRRRRRRRRRSVRVRPRYGRRRPPRRIRRWQHPRRVRAKTRFTRFELHLVNWSRHRNWRHAWKKLWELTRGRRRRIRVRVNPVRPHNGLRPRRRRRK